MAPGAERSGWLSDAPDFEDIVRAAAVHHQLLTELVRKDYWVTRVLRAVSSDPTYGTQCVFKGGTSLSKGWRLIDRFSHDVDLLLTGPDLGAPPATKGVREKHLAAIRDRIHQETPLRLPDLTSEYYIRNDQKMSCWLPLPGKTGGRGASDTDVVLVEAGFRGTPHPCSRLPLTSFVAEFIATQPEAIRDALSAYATDLSPFEMNLLRPDRTFAEKLHRVHTSAATVGWSASVPIRDYYDLSRLFRNSPDVHNALAGNALVPMLRDTARISNELFGSNIDVAALDLRGSAALRPSAEQAKELARRYAAEDTLYFHGAPRFADILADMQSIDERLVAMDWRPGAG